MYTLSIIYLLYILYNILYCRNTKIETNIGTNNYFKYTFLVLKQYNVFELSIFIFIKNLFSKKKKIFCLEFRM